MTFRLIAELGRSFTKDDCVNFQLPGCHLEQDKQENRSAGGTCNCLYIFFFLGGGGVASHALLIKTRDVKSQKNAYTRLLLLKFKTEGRKYLVIENNNKKFESLFL